MGGELSQRTSLAPDSSVNPRRVFQSHGQQHLIPREVLLRILKGVGVATKMPADDMEGLLQWFSTYGLRTSQYPAGLDFVSIDDTANALTLHEWLDAVKNDLPGDQIKFKNLADLALGLAFLREMSRRSQSINSAELEVIWRLIYGTLTSTSLNKVTFSAARSAQGFLAVPLCSLLQDGNISELFRFHVWLPDGQRGNPEFAIHSHQPFAQSWILAGEAKDHWFMVEPAEALRTATHAEYELSWSDGRGHGTKYQTHQTESVIKNTGRLVRSVPLQSSSHSRDMTYTIPSGTYHTTEVPISELHATLFYFDAHRGFRQDAPIIGPKHAEFNRQIRDAAGINPAELARLVDAVRSWEIALQSGQQHAQVAEWEFALRDFNTALHLCESVENFPNAEKCKHIVLSELGHTNRAFGRYGKARDILEGALADMGSSASPQRVEICGELGVVYRHMDRFIEAKQAFEDQLHTAKQLKDEPGICRALGNLGMVNYQLSQQTDDRGLLQLAMQQLHERVESARRIKRDITITTSDPNVQAHWSRYASTREVIGLARLSLCFTALGDSESAIEAAAESLAVAMTLLDKTVIAMSRFFYGRALLLSGERQLALNEFNPQGTCTPTMALCKEPSHEHRQYLKELVDAGADMSLSDENGYTALDFAVFNGDTAAVEIVIEGLRRSQKLGIEDTINQQQREAKLRKGYRELFQDKLRPVLSVGGANCMPRLRSLYTDALSADQDKSALFDRLKFVRYRDFQAFGKFPRYSDGLTQESSSKALGDHPEEGADFLIFFSYRWINKNPWLPNPLPDDSENTQFHRIISATEAFLALHPSINRDKLGVWIVSIPQHTLPTNQAIIFPVIFSPSPTNTDCKPSGLRMYRPR